MSDTTAQTVTSTGKGVLALFVERLAERRAERARRARIVLELSSYSDRGLSDLGLSRGDIRDVACGTYARA